MRPELEWLSDYAGALTTAALFAAIIGLCVLADRADENKCAQVMAYARTARDSMQATIACNELHAETARTISIGIAAGAVAGSSQR